MPSARIERQADMRPYNYSTHVIEQFHKTGLLSNGSNEPEAVKRIKSSIKFMLPDDGKILGLSPDEIAKYAEIYPVDLPYDCVTLEFGDSQESTSVRNVVTYWKEGDTIFAARIASHKGSAWEMDTPLYAFGMRPEGGLPEQYTFGIGSELMERNRDYWELMSWTLLDGLIEFNCALLCKNTMQEDVKTPKRFGDARAKKRKAPLFTYKVLSIEPYGHAVSPSLGGTHKSPRVHLRRGHIRRLSIGPVWVNACIVRGNGIGMVVKDYAVAVKTA